MAKNESVKRNNGITELTCEISQLVWERLVPLCYIHFFCSVYAPFMCSSWKKNGCVLSLMQYRVSFLSFFFVLWLRSNTQPASYVFAHTRPRTLKQETFKESTRGTDFRFLWSQSNCKVQSLSSSET